MEGGDLRTYFILPSIGCPNLMEYDNWDKFIDGSAHSKIYTSFDNARVD